MENKLYTVADISQELQCSKAYVYKILNKYKKELKPYKQTVKGVTYLSVEGLYFVKSKLNRNQESDDEIKEEINIESDPQQQLINHLQEEVKYLREQLQEKDNLIEKHISMLQEQIDITKREQLLRMTENQNILLLQQHIGDVDQKLTAWRETAATKEEKVSFFKKFWR